MVDAAPRTPSRDRPPRWRDNQLASEDVYVYRLGDVCDMAMQDVDPERAGSQRERSGEEQVVGTSTAAWSLAATAMGQIRSGGVRGVILQEG